MIFLILLIYFNQESMSSSDGTDKDGAKSCQGKFNQSSYIAENSDYDNPIGRQGRAARSYNCDEGEGWNQMTKQEQKQTFQQWGQQFKEKEKPNIKTVKRVKDEGKFIGDRKFTEEILDSESVSLQESAKSQINIQRVVVNQEPMRGTNEKKKVTYFNIMLVGASSTGKTTYMKCFLRQYKQHQNENQILDPTTSIKEHRLNPRFNHLDLESVIIDTPGYKASTFRQYLENVTELIVSRSKQYNQYIEKKMRESSIYCPEDIDEPDCRIHCCLLFFRGPRIHNDDWQLLKHLERMTNVIPLIAKGDSYTISEVKHFKNIIIERAHTQMVKWFDANQYIRMKHPEALKLLEEGPYGISPPFMIVGSNTKIDGSGQIKLSREYRWGTCYIENQSHTEFNVLNRLLIDYFREGLVKLTEIKLKRVMENQKQKAQLSKSKHFVMLGILIGGTAVAAWVLKKGDLK